MQDDVWQDFDHRSPHLEGTTAHIFGDKLVRNQFIFIAKFKTKLLFLNINYNYVIISCILLYQKLTK